MNNTLNIIYILAYELEVGDTLIPSPSSTIKVVIEKIGHSIGDGAVLINGITSDGDDFAVGIWGQSEVAILI
jgi:hypothetical protein